MHFNFHRELNFVYINVCQTARVSKNSPSILITYVTFSASGKEQKNAQDVSDTNQSATDKFFRLDSAKNFDKIIEELVKACQETKRNDKGRQDDASTINRIFSAGVKDGRIELGFHVKDNESLFRLSGGNLSSKEKRRNQPYHGIGKVHGVMMRYCTTQIGSKWQTRVTVHVGNS